MANSNITSSIKDKRGSIRYYINRIMRIVSMMVRIDGLPDTMPEREIKLILQTKGFGIVPDPEYTGGLLYMTRSGLGGPRNPYYEPTTATIANPWLPLTANLDIPTQCTIIRHDTMMEGLLPLAKRYAEMLTESDITLRKAMVDIRSPRVISARTDQSRKSADIYLAKIEAGEDGIIADEGLTQSVSITPTPGYPLTPLIELREYLNASLNMSVGLPSNTNRKRETINAAEAGLDIDAISPYVDDVIYNISDGFDRLNRRHGTHITVSRGEGWEDERLSDSQRKPAVYGDMGSDQAAGSETDMDSDADDRSAI